MWISNTATAAMMMTIVHALLEQFKKVDDEALEARLAEDAQVNGNLANHLR